MYINQLTLENFRAFRNATFDFRPFDGQLNNLYLLVGVNGVGKSSALDALRIAQHYRLVFLNGADNIRDQPVLAPVAAADGCD